MAVLQNILAPSVVTGIVSRIPTPAGPLSQILGVGIGGKKTKKVPGRSYSYDIMDNVRTIAKGRQPGVGPATHALAPIGRQTQTFVRSYEKTALDYETLLNIRQLGKDAGTRDRMGGEYVERQAFQQKLRQDHFREYMSAMLMTVGKAYYKFDGEDMIPVTSLSGVTGQTYDWLIPSANISSAVPGLNPLGTSNIIDAAWSTASTNIPGHLDLISIAFQQLVGLPLSTVVTDSTVWNYVLNNTKLQAQGGSVNSVFAEYDIDQVFKDGDGNPINVYTARLRARPWLKWVIVDTGLEVNGTYTKWYDGTICTFMADPNALMIQGVEGSEIVKDNPMAPPVERFGFWSWLREWDEPARVELHSLQNFLIEFPIPKGLMIGKVA